MHQYFETSQLLFIYTSVSKKSSKITAIVGAQWGDGMQGKITDYFAGFCDYVVRFHGGNNVGHTVVVDDKPVIKAFTFRYNIWKTYVNNSNGVVIDPKVLLDEIYTLK